MTRKEKENIVFSYGDLTWAEINGLTEDDLDWFINREYIRWATEAGYEPL